MTFTPKTLDELLAPISRKLKHDSVPDKVEIPTYQFDPRRLTDPMSKDDMVKLFVEEAEKVRVKVKKCTKADLGKTIVDLLKEGASEIGNADGVVLARDARFLDAKIPELLKEDGSLGDIHVWNADAADENVAFAQKATFGITYAEEGIAETATIVQFTTPECGRAISLLPLVHVAVIDADTLKPTMRDIVENYDNDAENLSSQVCFISGPSATADIELVRVEGVHGPMYVYYVVVE